MRNVGFAPQAWEDLLYWGRQDSKTRKRIEKLIEECVRSPFTGSGKPEPLRYEFQGYWSRRIDHVNRMVYKVTDEEILIASLRFHY